MTLPVAVLLRSCPMTVEVESLIRATWANVAPTSTIRPANAPPAEITTIPTPRPSSEPRSIVSTRRASLDSRAITEVATVWYSRPLRSWSRPVSCSFSRRSSAAARLSASRRWLSSRSSAFSWRSRSISAMVVAIDDTSRPTLLSATRNGLNANATPFCTSRTSGFDETVRRMSEATRRAM